MEIYYRLKDKCPETAMSFLTYVTSIMKWSEFEKSHSAYIYRIAAQFYGYRITSDPNITYDDAINFLIDCADKYEKAVIFVRENNIINQWSKDIINFSNEYIEKMFNENANITDTPEYNGFYNAISSTGVMRPLKGEGLIEGFVKSPQHDPLPIDDIDLTPNIEDPPF